MTAKDLLLYLLEHTYEREGAYPPLTTALAGLTAAQASWQPARERHSIWQIVRHMAQWRRGSTLSKLSPESTRTCNNRTGALRPVTNANGRQTSSACIELTGDSRSG